jgi:DNA-binding transcriptional MocR family regulator
MDFHPLPKYSNSSGSRHSSAALAASVMRANPDLSTLRLSFATADVAKIEEGVGRLGQAV